LEAAVPKTTNDEAAQGAFPSSSKAANPKAFSAALSSNASRYARCELSMSARSVPKGEVNSDF